MQILTETITAKSTRTEIADWCTRQADARLVMRAIAEVDHSLSVWCACAIAESTLELLPSEEQRPRIAVETARQWVLRKASQEQCKIVGDQAYFCLSEFNKNASRAGDKASTLTRRGKWDSAAIRDAFVSSDILSSHVEATASAYYAALSTSDPCIDDQDILPPAAMTAEKSARARFSAARAAPQGNEPTYNVHLDSLREQCSVIRNAVLSMQSATDLSRAFVLDVMASGHVFCRSASDALTEGALPCFSTETQEQAEALLARHCRLARDHSGLYRFNDWENDETSEMLRAANAFRASYEDLIAR